MASISSPGIGSGLDVTSIVSKLMEVEKRPLSLLQTKASTLQSKVSAYGQVKSALAGLYDAAKALTDTDTWKSKTITSSNANALTATVGSTALAGNFAVQVNALAKAQTLNSGVVPTGSAIGEAGKLRFETGTWSTDGTTFTGAGSPVTIDIAATDTLADIAGKVNSQASGLTAVVVKGTSGDQLLFRGTTTGAASGFSVSALDAAGDDTLTAGSALLKLDYDQVGKANGTSGMTQTAAAANASLSIDGIAVSSATNTVTSAVEGITLNLVTEGASSLVSVVTDTQSMKTKIEGFRDAYNKLNNLLAGLTKYDQASKSAQPLQGDGTAVGLQSALRGMIGTPGPASGSLNYLTDMGLQLQRDGTLSLDNTKLTSALSDLPNLQNFLTATDGLATRFRDFAFTANGSGGNVSNRNQALRDALSRNSTEQERATARLEQIQTRLLTQYSRLDSNLASLSSLNSFISQQVAQWNKK